MLRAVVGSCALVASVLVGPGAGVAGAAPAAGGEAAGPVGVEGEVAGPEGACVVVLGTPDPVTREVEAVSETCYPQGTKVVAPQAATLLMVWYEHSHWNTREAGASAHYYGYYGPCDRAGYRYDDLGAWRRVISSYRLYNNCATSRMWTDPYQTGVQSGLHYGDVPQMGRWNDNLGSFRIYGF